MSGLPQSRSVYEKGEHVLYLHRLQLRGEKNGPGSSGEGPVAAVEDPSLPSGFRFPVLLDFDASAVRAKRKLVAYKVRLSKDLMHESIGSIFFPDSSGIRHEGNCYIVIMADS